MFDAIKMMLYVSRFNKILRLYHKRKITGHEAERRIFNLEVKLPEGHFRLSRFHPPGYFHSHD